jgi:endonuclease III
VTAERISEIERRLDDYYGVIQPEIRNDPISELVGTILSQNTSDLNSERAFEALRARFPTWEAVLEADEEAVIDAIRAGGLAQVKGPRIKRVLRRIADDVGELSLEHLKALPSAEARAYLLSLPGVGVKTAACVQAFACGQAALPVDTHVHRLAIRLGLIPPATNAERAHDLLEAAVPSQRQYSLHVHLIRLGRQICKAQRPRCPDCPLLEICPRVGVA